MRCNVTTVEEHLIGVSIATENYCLALYLLVAPLMQLFLFPLTLKFLSPSLILIEIPPTIFGVCRIVVLGKLNTLVKQWIIDTSLAKVGRNYSLYKVHV